MIKKIIPLILIEAIKSFKPKLFSEVYFSPKKSKENVWINNSWLQISKDKLEEIKNEKVCDLGMGHLMIPTIYVNLLLATGKCKVLDYGGGTGFVYFKIFNNLTDSKNVEWTVVDYKELLEIGEKFSLEDKKYNINFQRLVFREDYDILYINSTMQYIFNYKNIIKMLLETNPEYIILNRLIAGDIPTHFSTQNIHGKKCQVLFLNSKEIINLITSRGYKIIFNGVCIEESFKDCYNKKIDNKYRIDNSINLVFKKIKCQ